MKAGIPTLYWGPPGVGKTATIEAAARECGRLLISPHVRDQEDLALHVVSEGEIVLKLAPAFRQALEAANAGKRVVIFVDEISTLRPSAQAALLRYLDSGVVGDTRLPNSVWRVAAANPPEFAADGTALEPPVANRLRHVDWVLDPVEWAEGFATYWGAPPAPASLGIDATPEEWGRARSLVAGFIRSVGGEFLLRIPGDIEARGGPWPSPRTWDFASRILAVGGAPLDVHECVGEAAANVLYEWTKTINIPEVAILLQSPQLAERLRSDELYVALATVAAHAAGSAATDVLVWEQSWRLAAHVAGWAADVAAGVLAHQLASLAREKKVVWDVPDQYIEPFVQLRALARGEGK